VSVIAVPDLLILSSTEVGPRDHISDHMLEALSYFMRGRRQDTN
jgi:hypothetical protein